jgi:dolichol kinase
MRNVWALAVGLFYCLLAEPAHALFVFPGNCGTGCLSAQSNALDALLWTPLYFYMAAFLLGLAVNTWGWQVGYTRKLLVLVFNAPVCFAGAVNLMGMHYPYQAQFSVTVVTITTIIWMLCITTLSQPFRKRLGFLRTAFASIDRPEDRPYTLPWLLSSTAATLAVIVAWLLLLPADTFVFLVVALLISSIGDALAEPVGLRFGRHKYAVRALGSDRIYTRSLEGSACVFLTGFVGVILMARGHQIQWNSTGALVLAALLLPTVATIAEAKSPHTWDQPFIIGSCGLTAWFIVWVNGLA